MKHVFLSKTFWITGIFPIIISVCDILTNELNWRQAVMAGFGAIAIVLRSLTKDPVFINLFKE